MLNLIAKTKDWIFMISGGGILLLHMMNTEKIFSVFHIANSILAIIFLSIVWAIISQKGASDFMQAARILSLPTGLIIIGFVQIIQKPGILLEDVSTIALISSIIPPFVNILSLIYVERKFQKA